MRVKSLLPILLVITLLLLSCSSHDTSFRARGDMSIGVGINGKR